MMTNDELIQKAQAVVNPRQIAHGFTVGDVVVADSFLGLFAPYSYLSVSNGSTLVSRRAGKYAFSNAIADPSALAREIARGAQQRVALFLASGGELIIHPEPARFFEVPVLLPLPEGLSYIP